MGNQVPRELKDALPITSQYEIATITMQLASKYQNDACCIALNNTTEYMLKNPSYYTNGRLIESPPFAIPSGFTAYILVQKSWFEFNTTGVISYEIDMANEGNNKLQIMWYVPGLLIRTCEDYRPCCSTRIKIGHETANEDLYEFHFTENDQYNLWWNANSTLNHIFNLDQTFEAEVYMKDKRQTSLIIDFRKISHNN